MSDKEESRKQMTIIYVKNQWGKSMPIAFEPCCDAMIIQFSPEGEVFQGYEFDRTTAKLIWKTRGGKITEELENCPHCDSKIVTEERHINNYTDYDPLCYFADCARQSTDSTEFKMYGFKVKIYACRQHSSQMMNLANRMGLMGE